MDCFKDKNVFVCHTPHEGKNETLRGIFGSFIEGGGRCWLYTILRSFTGSLHGPTIIAVDTITSIYLDPTEYSQ